MMHVTTITVDYSSPSSDMPYNPIQGQGQGHKCLKATQEESTISPARD